MRNLKNEVADDEAVEARNGISLFRLVLIGVLALFVLWLILVEVGVLTASCH